MTRVSDACATAGRSVAFKATRDELLRVLSVASLKMVLSDGLLHDGVCIGCARVDIRDKLCMTAAVPPCAIVSSSVSALLEDEWGGVQAVASLSLRLLDLGPSVLPHLIAAPLQQVWRARCACTCFSFMFPLRFKSTADRITRHM